MDGGSLKAANLKKCTLPNLSELFRISYTAAPLPIRKNQAAGRGNSKTPNLENFHALKPLRSLSDFLYCCASPHSKKLSGWTGDLKDCELEKFSRSQTSQISFGFCILPRLSPFEKAKRVDGGTQRLRTWKILTPSNLSDLFRILYTAAPLPIRKN